LVTGGGKGIGRGIVQDLAAQGHRILFTYFHSEIEADKLRNELVVKGWEIESYKIDLTRTENLKELHEYFRSCYGEVDVLINNAALSQEKPFTEISEVDFDQILTINLKIPFFLSQLVIEPMRAQQYGRIIHIASIGGQWGGINQIHYAVSKAGLINLGRSLAKTFGKNQITCNCISPGLVKTDMIEEELKTEAGKKKLDSIPAGRLGTIQEISATVRFLISDDAAYINGQTLNLNGGMLFN